MLSSHTHPHVSLNACLCLGERLKKVQVTLPLHMLSAGWWKKKSPDQSIADTAKTNQGWSHFQAPLILSPPSFCLWSGTCSDPNILKDVWSSKMHPYERRLRRKKRGMLEELEERIHQCFLCRGLFGICDIWRRRDTIIPHCKLNQK